MWDHLEVGAGYPVAEFVGRTAAALDEAAERVRARWGFACTSAMAQRDRIGEAAAAFPGDAVVRVHREHPPLPVPA